MDARPTLWQQPGVRRWLYLLYGIPLFGYCNLIGAITYALCRAPMGASIRPMALAAYMVVIAGITAIVGGALGLLTIVKWRREPLMWISGLVSTSLSISTFWGCNLYFDWLCDFRGLMLSK
jgi:hypothetical protein